MTITKEEFLALHCPTAKDQSMVHVVFEDGEHVLTKGGSLFGQRNFHVVSPSLKKKIDFDLPASVSGYKCIFANNEEDAKKAHEFIKEYTKNLPREKRGATEEIQKAYEVFYNDWLASGDHDLFGVLFKIEEQYNVKRPTR